MKFTNVKKWLAMLLVVCSMLSLVACGKSDKDSAGDDSEKGTKVAVVFASSVWEISPLTMRCMTA